MCKIWLILLLLTGLLLGGCGSSTTSVTTSPLATARGSGDFTSEPTSLAAQPEPRAPSTASPSAPSATNTTTVVESQTAQSAAPTSTPLPTESPSVNSEPTSKVVESQTAQSAAPTSTPLPTESPSVNSEPTTTVLPSGDIGMDPTASIMTTVVRVEQLEDGRATVHVEAQEEITALDISPETSFIYENGTPATLTALQIGTPIRATGGTSSGTLYTHEVVILTLPAGDAGMNPMASIMTKVVRVEQLEGGRATVFVEEQEFIPALDISPETSFIYEDGTPTTLAALQIGTPIHATGGTPSGGGDILYTHQVVILTPSPAGDAGMNPMASMTTRVVRVEQFEGGRATVFVEEQEEIRALTISPETIFIYEDGTPTTVAALQVGSPIHATGTSGGGVQTTNEVVILTPPAGELTSPPPTLTPLPVEGTEETQPASETFIISVKAFDSSDDAIYPTEPRGQITEINVNFYTNFSFTDGKPATYQDLAVGQVLQITGYLPPTEIFLATEVIILPREAGAGLFHTETITSSVASVDLAQQTIQLAEPWAEITQVRMSPQTELYIGSNPAILQELELDQPLTVIGMRLSSEGAILAERVNAQPMHALEGPIPIEKITIVVQSLALDQRPPTIYLADPRPDFTKVELTSGDDEIPVVFADGRVGSLDDLAVGQTLEVTGIFQPSGESTFLGRSIVILP